MSVRDRLVHLLRAASAGLLAGAFVGLGEVLLVVILGSNPARLQGMLWAVIAYGLLGLVGGIGFGLVFSLILRYTEPSRVCAITWALVFSGLGLPIARYRLYRDLLHEGIRTFSAMGLLFHLALVLFFGLICLGAVWLWQRRALQLITQPRGSLMLFGLLVFGASIVTLLAQPDRSLSTTPEIIPPQLQDAPNIILIGVETLRADHLSAYGYTKSASPHIDSLAEDGVIYREMTAQASWTKPSFGTILTGLYPSTHTATGKPHNLPQPLVTVAEAIQAGGYHTGGVITNVQISPGFGYDQGFNDYVYLEPNYAFAGNEAVFQLALHAILRRAWAIVSGDKIYVQDFYRDARAVNRQALTWLEANQDSRFFLFIQYFDPHDPYFEHPYDGFGHARASNQNPDPEMAPAFVQLYDGEIFYLDGYLGELFEWLQTHHLYDDTLIILTSDHGEEFKDHNGWWHGTTLYQEQVAVPLIIKYPGNKRAGTVDTNLARSVDIAPTILAAAGLPTPSHLVGRSLERTSEPPEYAYAEENHEGNIVHSIRTKAHKLILANSGNPRGLPTEALFDLIADPGEKHNIIDAQPEVAAKLREALRQILTDAMKDRVDSETSTADSDIQERLRALGY